MEFTSEITVNKMQQVGGDAMVVAAAKVSTDPDEALEWALEEHAEDARGLINYLMTHRHGSCFEHGQMTVFADVPIFVWREWHRHRVWSYNEQSARYGPLAPKFWIPTPYRKMRKAPGHKSSRPKFEPINAIAHADYVRLMQNSYKVAWDTYDTMMEERIAPEVARAVLPVAIYSKGWATANPRGIMSFLSLRVRDENATFESFPQAEIEEAARQLEQFFAEEWPITYECYVKNGRVAP